ncbi:hypothetical protein [Desulfobacca acetoxidans]|uniref:Uncharacterized protein n=1 Tax=Desulfobacca acetoxidans (strain ATCC 700848 / DSM 11109 / ASRB2) TaxID=880072 RepID=F2NI22_DESAR|nr:hypothetical protein [Desulfobacca acetoxidans]AEB09648.1 hypothetical protein Desac_1808 [Desulfobacca acetoxidans DSM 11109]
MDIHIGNIRVRAQNLTPAQGRQLGERIGTLLAERLARGEVLPREAGRIWARVSGRGNETMEQLAVQVVRTIIEGM